MRDRSDAESTWPNHAHMGAASRNVRRTGFRASRTTRST